MRKLFAVILSLFYICISTGATIHMHYCMGKLVDSGLWHSDSEQCSNCGMSSAKAGNCCKDEHQFIKLEKDQKISEISIQLDQLSAYALLPALVSSTAAVTPTIIKQRPVNHPPPLRSNKTIYLLNCVFRIWYLFLHYRGHQRSRLSVSTVVVAINAKLLRVKWPFVNQNHLCQRVNIITFVNRTAI